MNINCCFGDQEIMGDALNSQKFITGSYNTVANEFSDNNLRNQIMTILNDEHQIQYDIFQTMQQRGWYATTPAEQTKINQALQKFQSGAQ